jgi:putative peptidoglycan lipid II flippase
MNAKLIRQSLLSATFIMVGANILGRMLGFVREAVVADLFGTSAVFDTFVLAFTVPELLTFVIFAALPTAIIPSLAQGDGAAGKAEGRFFWKGLGAFGVIFASLAALVYLLRGQILGLLAPGLEATQQSLGISLMALLSLFVLFRGMEAYFRGWLIHKRHFIVPSLSPFVLNPVVVGGVLLLYGRLDIMALAYGWVASAACLFLLNGIMALMVVRPGWPSAPQPASVRTLLKFTLVVALIEALTLFYSAIDRYLAVKFLSDGQIAALRYALYLSQLAPSVLVVTFSLASFPWVADLTRLVETERLARLYRESLFSILFVMALLASAMAWFAEDIVRVAFQRGAFDGTSLSLTSSPFRYYAIGVFFYSAFHFQTRFYYARKAAWRLGVILSVALGAKVIFSLLLVGPFQHDGLAMATSLAWTLGTLLMTVDLARTAMLSIDGIARPAIKLFAALSSTLVFFAGVSFLWPAGDGRLVWSFFRLAAIVLCGSGIYLAVAILLGMPEPRRIWQAVASRGNASPQ